MIFNEAKRRRKRRERRRTDNKQVLKQKSRDIKIIKGGLMS